MTAALLDRTVRQPAGRPARRPSTPRLQVLDQAAARRRSRHRRALLVLFIIVLAGFFAVAWVHAELVAGQNELDTVRSAITEAEARHAELARAVEEASSPASIVERATNDLGMVEAPEPLYLVAAAPVRDIQVQPALATLIASEGPESGQAATVEVAAPTGASAQGTAPDADRALRGSLGMAGGISAAVRLPDTPTLALGATDGEQTATRSADTGSIPSAPADPSTPSTVAAGTGSILAGASTGPAPGAAASDGARAGVGAVSAGATVTVASGHGSSLAGSRAASGVAGATAGSGSTSGLATAAAATGAG